MPRKNSNVRVDDRKVKRTRRQSGFQPLPRDFESKSLTHKPFADLKKLVRTP